MTFEVPENTVDRFIVVRNNLPRGNSPFVLVSGTAYFSYMGRTNRILTPKYVEIAVSTVGVGAQTAEIGFFSTPLPPNKAGQSLTKLVSSGSLGALTSTGVVRNTSAFTTAIPAFTHVWAGIRTAMATTQPDLIAIGRDFLEGAVLSLVGSGVLTGAGPFSGGIIATSADQCPDMRLCLE